MYSAAFESVLKCDVLSENKYTNPFTGKIPGAHPHSPGFIGKFSRIYWEVSWNIFFFTGKSRERLVSLPGKLEIYQDIDELPRKFLPR